MEHLLRDGIRDRPAADEQQAAIGMPGDQRGHRRNQIVQSLVIVETADESDHRSAAQTEFLRQPFVARWRFAEQ